MPITFDITLKQQDLFRFNMYCTYTSPRGIISLVLGAVVLVIVAVSDSFSDFASAFPYLVLGLAFLFYLPISLRLNAGVQLKRSEALSGTLHYTLTDRGVEVTAEGLEEQAVLPWENIYKAVTTRRQFLIFSSRIHAYIIPKEQVLEKLPEIYELFAQHCQAYRLHIKK